jgi:GTPase-associated protein 1, N-terminal domain type 2/GTPase-associated protein 1, middle domain
MKQLYYTSCRLGHSINGQSGFQVRAVTPGIDHLQLRAAVAYVGYKPPDSIPRTEDAVATAPVRLALLDTPDLGRILLHSVYVGREGEGTRGGNFFSHLLLDVPRELAAGDAIRLWRSAYWQCKDGDFHKNLAETALPSDGEAPDLDPARLLADERGQEMLRFLLDALLLPRHAKQRIFLAAPALEVACCVYAATTVLPRALTRELTFSTYEYAPLTCRARVIGANPDAELPPACYSDSCLGFHRDSGRKSPLGGATPYADYAVRQTAQGKLNELARFAEMCEKRRVDNAGLLDLAFRLAKKDYVPTEDETRHAIEHGPLGKEVFKRPAVIARLSREDCQLALQDPELTAELCRYPDALERIAGWGVADAEFHQESLPPVIEHLDEMEELDRPLHERKDLSRELQKRLGGWLFLRRLMKTPSLESADLVRAGNVLLESVPDEARAQRVEEMTDTVATAYFTHQGRNPQGTLEAIIVGLAREAPALVYGRLCEFFIAHAGDELRFDLVHALVAVGFGQCGTSGLAEALGETGARGAESFIRALKESKQRNLLLAIRNGARDWPPDVRDQVRRLIPLPLWTRLRRSLRSRHVRIILLVVLLCLAVWGIVSLFGRKTVDSEDDSALSIPALSEPV